PALLHRPILRPARAHPTIHPVAQSNFAPSHCMKQPLDEATQKTVDALVASVAARDALFTFFHLDRLESSHLSLSSSTTNRTALETAFLHPFAPHSHQDSGLFTIQRIKARRLILQVLLLKGADPFGPDSSGASPIDVAEAGRDELALELLNEFELGTYDWKDAGFVCRSKARDLEWWLIENGSDRKGSVEANPERKVRVKQEVEDDLDEEIIFMDVDLVNAAPPSPPPRKTRRIPMSTASSSESFLSHTSTKSLSTILSSSTNFQRDSKNSLPLSSSLDSLHSESPIVAPSATKFDHKEAHKDCDADGQTETGDSDDITSMGENPANSTSALLAASSTTTQHIPILPSLNTVRSSQFGISGLPPSPSPPPARSTPSALRPLANSSQSLPSQHPGARAPLLAVPSDQSSEHKEELEEGELEEQTEDVKLSLRPSPESPSKTTFQPISLRSASHPPLSSDALSLPNDLLKFPPAPPSLSLPAKPPPQCAFSSDAATAGTCFPSPIRESSLLWVSGIVRQSSTLSTEEKLLEALVRGEPLGFGIAHVLGVDLVQPDFSRQEWKMTAFVKVDPEIVDSVKKRIEEGNGSVSLGFEGKDFIRVWLNKAFRRTPSNDMEDRKFLSSSSSHLRSSSSSAPLDAEHIGETTISDAQLWITRICDNSFDNVNSLKRALVMALGRCGNLGFEPNDINGVGLIKSNFPGEEQSSHAPALLTDPTMGGQVGEAIQQTVDALVAAISERNAFLAFYHLDHLSHSSHLSAPASTTHQTALETALHPFPPHSDLDPHLAGRLDNATRLIIQVLLLKGADPWTPNKSGLAPVDVAEAGRNELGLELLREWEMGSYDWAEADYVKGKRARDLKRWLVASGFDREQLQDKRTETGTSIKPEPDDDSDDIVFMDVGPSESNPLRLSAPPQNIRQAPLPMRNSNKPSSTFIPLRISSPATTYVTDTQQLPQNPVPPPPSPSLPPPESIVAPIISRFYSDPSAPRPLSDPPDSPKRLPPSLGPAAVPSTLPPPPPSLPPIPPPMLRLKPSLFTKHRELGNAQTPAELDAPTCVDGRVTSQSRASLEHNGPTEKLLWGQRSYTREEPLLIRYRSASVQSFESINALSLASASQHPAPPGSTSALPPHPRPFVVNSSTLSYNFQPLIAYLQLQRDHRALFSAVGVALQRDRLYTSLKDYCLAAERAGVVKNYHISQGRDEVELVIVSKARNEAESSSGQGRNTFETNQKEQIPTGPKAWRNRSGNEHEGQPAAFGAPLRRPRSPSPPPIAQRGIMIRNCSKSIASSDPSANESHQAAPQRSLSPDHRRFPPSSSVYGRITSQNPTRTTSLLYISAMQTLNQPDTALSESLKLALANQDSLGLDSEDIWGLNFNHQHRMTTALVQIDPRMAASVKQSLEVMGGMRLFFNGRESLVSINRYYEGPLEFFAGRRNSPPPPRPRSNSRRSRSRSPLPRIPRTRSPVRHRSPSPSSGSTTRNKSWELPARPRIRKSSPPLQPRLSVSHPTKISEYTSQNAQLVIIHLRTKSDPPGKLRKDISKVLGRCAFGFTPHDVFGVTFQDSRLPDEVTAYVEIDPRADGKLRRAMEEKEARSCSGTRVILQFNDGDIEIQLNQKYAGWASLT
ncbi:hypothetical protein P7C70_g7095, partial [Phenoliferia sp. Uapishka_3]